MVSYFFSTPADGGCPAATAFDQEWEGVCILAKGTRVELGEKIDPSIGRGEPATPSRVDCAFTALKKAAKCGEQSVCSSKAGVPCVLVPELERRVLVGG